MHNTRLFPKHRGAAAYRLTGIAERCDWSIMTDLDVNDVVLHGDDSKQPRTVFLSLRSFYRAIPYFYEEILPGIENRFVFVTGSEDITVPNQLDARWRPFNTGEKELIEKIISDERLIHWFAENRDEDRPKMSTLPTGYVFINETSNTVLLDAPDSKLKNRPLKALCAHRVREGRQWDVRRDVSELCRQHFKDFTTVLEAEISSVDFRRLVRQHAFVLCAQGGGNDPSPKAWMCIANGSIPIIRSSVLNDAYAQLPVAFVDEWDSECLNEEILQNWVEDLAPYYDNDVVRAITLKRLSLDYWWNKVMEVYEKSFQVKGREAGAG